MAFSRWSIARSSLQPGRLQTLRLPYIVSGVVEANHCASAWVIMVVDTVSAVMVMSEVIDHEEMCSRDFRVLFPPGCGR